MDCFRSTSQVRHPQKSAAGPALHAGTCGNALTGENDNPNDLPCSTSCLLFDRLYGVYWLIDLESVRGLAKTHQNGLGFVHAHTSDPSKELGQCLASKLVEILADRCDATLETILERERERERKLHYVIQPGWLMRTGLFSCLSLLQQGNETT